MQGGIAILIEYATISMACGKVLIFLAVIGLVLFLSNIFLMYQLQRRQALVEFKVLHSTAHFVHGYCNVQIILTIIGGNV